MPRRVDRPTTPITTTTPERRPATTNPGTPKPAGWNPQQPRRTTTTPTGPGPNLAPVDGARLDTVAGARALSPTDALKAVKNGEVELAIPLKAGDLVPGKLTAKNDTVIRLALKVKDGVIDFEHSTVKVDPGLTGPHGLALNGVKMLPDGRAEVDIPHFPDPVIGNKAPSKLSDFVDSLQTTESLPVKILGITVANLKTGVNGTDAKTPKADDLSKMFAKIDLSQSRVSVKNVQFNDGAVPLPGGGRVRLAPDTKLSIEGTLNDMSLKGHADVQDLDLDAGGTSIRGARGTADVDVRWTGDPTTTGNVTTKLSNLNLSADYAVSKRENGDFVELAKGKIENGSLTLSQNIGGGGLSGKPTADLKIGHFDGVVNQAQITVPDGDGTATIRLGKTSVKGEVEVNSKHVLVSGDVELDAHVTGLDTPGDKARLSFSDVSMTGKAHATFDSAKGLSADGNVRVKATLEHGDVAVRGQQGELTKSTLDVTATKVNVARGGGVDIRGKADVNVGFRNIDAGEKGVSLKGGTGSVTGKADVEISDTGGIHLSNGNLKLKASVQDGKVSLGDSMSMDLKAGTNIDSALTDVVFNRNGVALDMGKTHLDATLDQGTVTMPNGQKVNFKDGAKLDFTLDRLKLPQKGIPEASGSLQLSASVGADQIDTRSLLNLPGVTLSSVEGVDQSFNLRLGRFSIQKDGQFELSDMKFGIEASIRHMGGVIR